MPAEKMSHSSEDFEKEIEQRSRERVAEQEDYKAGEIEKLLGDLAQEPSDEDQEKADKNKQNARVMAERMFRGLLEKPTKKKTKESGFLKKMLGEERHQTFVDLEDEIERGKSQSTEGKMASFTRLYDALREEKDLEKKDQLQEEILQRLQEIQSEEAELDGPLLQAMIAHAIEEKEKVREEISELPNQSPEAFMGISIKELREYKKQLDSGALVETPWVKKTKEEITENLKSHRNVFLFGETGTGKTEVARVIAREMTGKGEIMIRGHKFMTPEEVWGYLGLAAKEGKVNDTEILQAIKNKNPESTPEEVNEIFQASKEVLMGKSTSQEIETKYFVGSLVKAAKEGRVLVIDESNYIPPGLLASMNEILANPKPGRKITIPLTGEEVEIAKGFGVIMTGNIAFDSIKRYKDRYETDPALKDRVKFIEYNTPPQEIGREHDYKADVEKDLFLVALADLADKKGNVSVAGGEEGLRKVWRLCQAFKLFQENFAGRPGTKYKDAGGQEFVVPLAKNHASMRKLRNIMGGWKKEGQKFELDQYVWKELIEPSLTEPTEAAYFYQQLQVLYGFFDSEGWDQNPNYGQGLKMTRFEVDTPSDEEPNQADKIKSVSVKDVSEAIRGHQMPIDSIKTGEELMSDEKRETMVRMEAEVDTMRSAWQKEQGEILKCCPAEPKPESGCFPLLQKLNDWKDKITDLEKAKNTYLGSFKKGDGENYETAKTDVSKLEQEYKELKRNSYIEVKSGYEGETEKLFFSDYETLGKVFEDVNGENYLEKDFKFGTWNHIRTVIEDGRLTTLEIQGRGKDAFKHVKYLDALKSLSIANNYSIKKISEEFPPNLEYLNIWGNTLESLPDLTYLNKLKEFICGNNRLGKQELLNMKLPASMEKVTIRDNPGVQIYGGYGDLDEKSRKSADAIVEKLKQIYPKTDFDYKR